MEDLISATCSDVRPETTTSGCVATGAGAGVSIGFSAGAVAAAAPELDEANAETAGAARKASGFGTGAETGDGRGDSTGALQTEEDDGAALAEAVREIGVGVFGAEPPPVGRLLVPLPRSASSSSSGARRAALTRRSKPISRWTRGSILRRTSSSVCRRIWK